MTDASFTRAKQIESAVSRLLSQTKGLSPQESVIDENTGATLIINSRRGREVDISTSSIPEEFRGVINQEIEICYSRIHTRIRKQLDKLDKEFDNL